MRNKIVVVTISAFALLGGVAATVTPAVAGVTASASHPSPESFYHG